MRYVFRLECDKCHQYVFDPSIRTLCSKCGYSVPVGEYFTDVVGHWKFNGIKFWFIFPYLSYSWMRK